MAALEAAGPVAGDARGEAVRAGVGEAQASLLRQQGHHATGCPTTGVSPLRDPPRFGTAGRARPHGSATIDHTPIGDAAVRFGICCAAR